MNWKTSKSLDEALANLRRTEDKLLQLGIELLSADSGNMFSIDLIAIGAMKRTASNTEGFILLIESKNMSSARSLLRVQIDTFIRFSSLWIVDSPHDFAAEIIHGKHIRNIKDKLGNKMTDRYLIEILSKEYPWIRNVYDNLSGYIHFSSQHLFNSVNQINNDTKTISFKIGKEDRQYQESSWIETVDCFVESTNILFFYLKSWIEIKNEKKELKE